MKEKPYRPQGQITRGKTARNRLRRSDIFLLLTEHDLLTRRAAPWDQALYVDLGYGAEAFTTLESAERLRTVNPGLKVLGVEIDPERVAVALPYQDEKTYFRLGGFNIPLLGDEKIRLIRAFNVLRQYDESEFDESVLNLGRQLLPGGLLIEGTSNPPGSIWTANLIRHEEASGEIVREGFLFSTNFHQGFEPEIFQPYLTKNYIHRMLPGEEINEFISDWKSACLETVSQRSFGLRSWFIASAQALKLRGYDVSLRPVLLKQGFLLWKKHDVIQ